MFLFFLCLVPPSLRYVGNTASHLKCSNCCCCSTKPAIYRYSECQFTLFVIPSVVVWKQINYAFYCWWINTYIYTHTQCGILSFTHRDGITWGLSWGTSFSTLDRAQCEVVPAVSLFLLEPNKKVNHIYLYKSLRQTVAKKLCHSKKQNKAKDTTILFTTRRVVYFFPPLINFLQYFPWKRFTLSLQGGVRCIAYVSLTFCKHYFSSDSGIRRNEAQLLHHLYSWQSTAWEPCLKPRRRRASDPTSPASPTALVRLECESSLLIHLHNHKYLSLQMPKQSLCKHVGGWRWEATKIRLAGGGGSRQVFPYHRL